METAYPDPSQILPFEFKINRQADIYFTLLQDGAAISSVTGWTWALRIKKNAGDRLNVTELTLGYGLSYDTYSDIVLHAHFTSAQNKIEEGEYFIELIRTDLEKTWMEGKCNFRFSKKNSQDTMSSELTIDINSTTQAITLNVVSGRTITVAGGDVSGPASATDRALAIFDGTTGKLIQNSTPTIDANGNLIIPFTNTGPYQGVTLANQSTANFSGGGFGISGAGVTAWLLGLFYAQQVNVNNSRVRIDGVSNNATALFLDIDGSLSNRAKFIGPVRVQEYATGSLPAANLHPYSFAYDTTIGAFLFSNGTSWIPVQSAINTATALTDAATIDITGPNHTLTTASSRTFTKSYTPDESNILITLNATSATFTLPAGHYGIFNGTSSGTNSLIVTGATSGDKIAVTIGKVGNDVIWIAKNISR